MASRIFRWSEVNVWDVDIDIPGSKISNIIEKQKIDKQFFGGNFSKNYTIYKILQIGRKSIIFHIVFKIWLSKNHIKSREKCIRMRPA